MCASHQVYFLSQKLFYILLCHKNFFSCETKKLFGPVKQDVLPVTGFVLPLMMDIHPMGINSIFSVTRTIFLVTENSFLMKFGLSFRCIILFWTWTKLNNWNLNLFQLKFVAQY